MKSRQSADGSARPHLQLNPPLGDCTHVLNLAVGDVVVYASHGIGCVEARRTGGGDLPEAVVLVFESGLRVTLPVARARGALRSLSGEVELEDVRRTLRADPAPRIEPWSRRFHSMREKVTAGEVTGLAEVVRDGLQRERQLAVGAGGRTTAAPSERGLYLQARKLLADEIAFARGIDAVKADVWIDEQIDEHAQR
jgi:RNA polymerase-interacting CarD/CdnL/TRCF family regulator